MQEGVIELRLVRVEAAGETVRIYDTPIQIPGDDLVEM